MSLVGKESVQLSLFSTNRRDGRLMQVMDRINAEWGRGALHSAAEGVQKGWKMRWERMSPAYTTRWDQLPVVC